MLKNSKKLGKKLENIKRQQFYLKTCKELLKGDIIYICSSLRIFNPTIEYKRKKQGEQMKLNIKANGLENRLETDKVSVAYACHHRKGWRAN